MSLQGIILLSYFPGLLLHFPRNHVLTPYISTSRIISTFVSNGPTFLLKIITSYTKERSSGQDQEGNQEHVCSANQKLASFFEVQ